MHNYLYHGKDLNLGLNEVSGTLLVTIISLLVALIVYANYHPVDNDAFLQKRDPNLPGPYEIVAIYCYPIKSCRGFQVGHTRLRKSGVDLDRYWVFVDENNNFLTIRDDPTMTLIGTELSEDRKELIITIPKVEEKVTIGLRPTPEWLKANTTLEKIEIWGEKTDGWAYSDAINAPFSKFFDKPVKLIYNGPTPRIARGNADPSLYGTEVAHNFADLMSVQIANETSLADLNRRLKEKLGDDTEELTIERFRPNIVVKGATPWEEDSWKKVQLITTMPDREQLWRIALDVVARCARCTVPNVNPDTAVKDLKEPWDTLFKFRRVDSGQKSKYKPCFGMLCLPNNEGEIRVGAMLEVLETTEKHVYGEARFADL